MSRLLLVWDAPNLDMGLGALLGGRPTTAHRPRFDAVGRWLLAKAGELAHTTGSKVESEATVFANVVPGSADSIRSWVEALRNVGFAVFAKPKLRDDTDVDPDMLAHIRKRFEEGDLAGVIVASADGRNFQETLDELASAGVAITVIGFHEHATWALANDRITFVDLEEIPGVFREPLPRVSLDNLPEEGAWLKPIRPLSALLSKSK
ncbi:NYN domain-containing protein [Corynebacterium diphtheriae]